MSNEDGVERNDGMDISIVTINTEKQRLYFAGAKNPLYIVYKDEIEIKKGSFFRLAQINTTLKNSTNYIKFITKKKRRFTCFQMDFKTNSVEN